MNVDKIINAFTKIFCKRCKRLSHLCRSRQWSGTGLKGRA